MLITLQGGQENADVIEHPKMIGLSPIAMMLYGLGFLGMLFLYWGGTNLQRGNEKLGGKQVIAGFTIILAVYLTLTIVFGVGNDNWRQI